MRQYLDLLRRVRRSGAHKGDRTGTGTLSVFGHQMRFDLAEGFPLVTTKKLHLKSIIHELLWFLSGDTNVRYLNKHGVTIWDEWADEKGDLGPIYGCQWRSWPAADGRHIDQIVEVVESLKTDPNSRRHIVTAWNPGDLDKMALAPCHCLFQFWVGPEEQEAGSAASATGKIGQEAGSAVAPKARVPRDGATGKIGQEARSAASATGKTKKRKLSCQLYQRSADIFLGVPFNIASYALLTQMVAQVTGYEPGEFIHTLGDAHLYLNHLEQADLQLQRAPRPLPRMEINPEVTSLFDFVYDDFKLVGYEPHPHIKAKVAV